RHRSFGAVVGTATLISSMILWAALPAVARGIVKSRCDDQAVPEEHCHHVEAFVFCSLPTDPLVVEDRAVFGQRLGITHRRKPRQTFEFARIPVRLDQPHGMYPLLRQEGGGLYCVGAL